MYSECWGAGGDLEAAAEPQRSDWCHCYRWKGASSAQMRVNLFLDTGHGDQEQPRQHNDIKDGGLGEGDHQPGALRGQGPRPYQRACLPAS